jgi:hypothetical protein
MPDMGEAEVSALGELPLERYVLSRWNDSAISDLNPDARRKRLTLEFVQLGSLGRCVSRRPSNFTKIQSLLPARIDSFW